MAALIGIALSQGLSANEKISAGAIEEVRVVGRREFLQTEFRPDRTGFNRDVSQLMARVPGGAANANGPLSGQIQYRGMTGPRVNVRVDGMLIHGGGPNWMAPPLHHIPTGLMEEIVVERGIPSIATGGGLGGAVTARWKKPEYSAGDLWRWTGDLEASAGTVDDGSNVAGVVGLASDSHRFYLLGSRDDGEDYESARGNVAATGYRRDTLGVGYGFSSGDHELDLDWRRLATDDTGTPSLPMDIDWFDTDLWNLRYTTRIGDTGLEFRLYGSDIDHGMSNFLLRPAPDFSALPLPPFQGDDKRFARALSDELGFKASLEQSLGAGTLQAGIEGKFAEHDVTVTDPDVPSFFVDNFRDSESESLTAFGQWAATLGGNWYWELGAAVHRVETGSGSVDAMPARLVDDNPAAWPMGTPPRAVWLLRERFNSGDRKHEDINLDWVIKTRYEITDEMIVELAASRRERSPLYLERYLWIPLETNAGIGDGNNYMGDPDLKPETAHQVELGLDVDTGRFHLSPRLFYREVDNYIQGVPATDPAVIAVSGNANGDPTPLRFANTEARFWGADLDFGVQLAPRWRLDGSASLVRAERRDIDDDLFRIAPDTLRASLSYQRAPVRVQLEQVLVDEQDRISATNTLDPANGNNSFASTSGYGLTNLFVDWYPRRDLTVTLGVENLWGKAYTDHLTGFNRVRGSGIAVGHRLPGQGRNLFSRLHYQW
ncbi:MAG: TonB-dependent receptor [Halioglobus sp.]|nr:TonB-dependent receptor [Halioglobus sp.]